MELSELKAKGAFIEGVPEPVEVEWTHIDKETGDITIDTFIVHVLRKSVGWMDRAFKRARADGGSQTAAIIAEGIRFGENANERITYEEASKLDIDLATALSTAFNKVNKRDFDVKNSQPQTSSGANSSSAASEDAQ